MKLCFGWFPYGFLPLIMLAAGCGVQAAGTSLEGVDAGVHQSQAAVCRLAMTDSSNAIETVLQVEMVNRFNYIVTNGYGSARQSAVSVAILSDGTMQTIRGVPEMNLVGLLTGYVYEPGGQVVLSVVEGYACTQIEFSLAYFMIMEWFYYG